MKMSYTWEEVESWRDRIHRRLPRLAVKTKKQALKFIDDVGFCFAFKSDASELPCLWHSVCGVRNPVMPRHTHHDPSLSFVWEMKNVLPGRGKIYYGKVIKRRPTMISLEYLSYFYVLAGRTGAKDEYLTEFMRGGLSPGAKAIMDALSDSSPQVTKGLRLATGKHAPGDRESFDKAITELQVKMYIVKEEELRTPFTFIWAPLRDVFPDQIRKARKISVEAARNKILERYFRNQLIGSVDSIHNLFGWSKQGTYQSLGQLVQDGIIVPHVKVGGKDGKFYCLVG